MANISVASLPCFSLDEKILHILWDEGVQMEELLDFSFERVGKLADERGVQLDDAHKEELWLYVQRMKAEQPDWVSLSHYQDRSSQQQQFDSCLDNFTEVSRFHTAQLSWDPCQSWEEPRQASFSRDSLEITALPCEEKGDADERDVKPKSSKRMCKTPKTFRLSKCDLSPISPKPRATVRRSRSKVAALLRRLVHEKTTNEPVEDHFFTRGIWPSWLNFSATPKQSSPTPERRSGAAFSGRQKTPLLLRWLGRKRSHGYRVSAARQRR